MRKTISILMCLMMSLTLWAHDFEVDGIYYDVMSESSRSVGVTHMTSTSNDSNSYSGELVIPDNVTYNGTTYTVEYIRERAFQGSTDLTKVTLGKNIKQIAQYAFLHTWNLNALSVGNNTNYVSVNGVLYTADKKSLLFCPRNATSLTVASETETIADFSLEQCVDLTSVVMNGKVKTLGTSSFYGCISLHSLDLKNSVTEIGRAAFKNSKNVYTITGTSKVQTVGISAFEDSGFKGELDLQSVVTVGEYAFQNCGITKLTLGPVTEMGNAAFKNNRNLTTLLIKNGATVIGSQAFYGCVSLASITSECVTPPTISINTFTSIEDKVSLTVPQGSADAYKSAWIGNMSSDVTINGTGEVVPDVVSTDLEYKVISAEKKTAGVTSRDTKYSGVYQIADEVTIDGVTYKVTEILEKAFYNCPAVTKVILGKNIVTIGKEAFYSSGITEMDLNDQVTRIEDRGFIFCKKLTKFTGLNALEYIGSQAFYTDPIEGEIYLPNIKRLVSYPFQGVNITKITLGENLETGTCARECKYLKEIIFLGNKFTEVSSLDQNTALESITLPETVTKLASWAFRKCTSLKEVKCGSIKDIGYEALQNTALESFDFSNVLNIGYNAFENTKLTEIVLNDKISSIGKEAFKGCKNVKTIKCLNLNVPTTDENAFDLFGDGAGEVVVTVPAYSLEAYKAAWKEQLENGVAKVTFVGDESIKAEIGIDENDEVAINGLNFPVGEIIEIASANDADGNGKLSRTERESVTSVTLNSSMTKSIKGLEYFEKLSKLRMQYCDITDIDLSPFKELTYIYIYWTDITELDLTNNPKLTSVTFSENNKLAVVHFNEETSNTIKIGVGRNAMTGVGFEDFYGSLNYISDGGIQSVNMGVLKDRSFTIEGLDMNYVSIPSGFEEQCQIVNGKFVPKFSESKTTFRYVYSFKGYGSFPVVVTYQCSSDVPLSFFGDENLRNCLKAFDTDNDGLLSSAERAAVTTINVASKEIKSLAGIEVFTSLESLNCSKNNLVDLDLSAFSSLAVLNHSGNTRELGSVLKSGFTVEGLDMSRVKTDDIYGADIKDGKFVPNGKYENKVYYGYDTKSPNDDFKYIYVTLSYTPLCEVTFVDYDGTVITKKKVVDGAAVVAPANPTREGYQFVGWDTSLDKIESDVTITAQYKRNLEDGEIEINRENFRDEVIYKVAVANDADKSGTLTLAEIANIKNVVLEYSYKSSYEAMEAIEHIEDIDHFKDIESLEISYSRLKEVDFSNLPKLHKLKIATSYIENGPDFSTAPSLDTLVYKYTKASETIDISQNTKLKFVNVDFKGSALKHFNIGELPSLKSLVVWDYSANTLDLSGAVNLETLSVISCSIAYLDLDKNTKLNGSETRVLQNTLSFKDVDATTGFAIEGLDMSKVQVVDSKLAKVVDGKFVPSLSTTSFTYRYLTGNETVSYILVNVSVSCNITINETSFPDANFRRYVENNIDTNGDNILSSDEASAVENVDVRWKFIKSLEGLQYFTNLKSLDCSQDSLISLDLAPFTKLESLESSKNTRDIKGYVSSITGFEVEGLDLSRVDPTTVDGGVLRDGKFYPAANSSSLSYDYATNSPVAEFATFRPHIQYNRLCVVKFVDYDGTLVATKETVKGQTVELPTEELSRPGYTFKGWGDESLETISYDKTFNAVYEFIEGGVADTIKIEINDVNFPDDNFRLEVKDFDLNKDGFITTSEVLAVKEVQVSSRSIYDLKGIEFFTELTSLIVNANSLESLDLSKNTKLESLQCYKNKIAKLDLSNNTSLKLLLCRDNEMKTLILPQTETLYDVECQSNKLSSLDVSKCPNLSTLYLHNNNFAVFSTQGVSIKYFTGQDNTADVIEAEHIVIPGMDMSKVKDVEGATVDATGFFPTAKTITYGYEVGTYTTYSGTETNMIYVTLTLKEDETGYIEINEENFPDKNFRSYVSNNIDKDSSNKLSPKEIEAVETVSLYWKFIKDLKGLEYFTNLKSLNVSKDSLIALDLEPFTQLESLSANENVREIKGYVSSISGFAVDGLDMDRVDAKTVKNATLRNGKFYPASNTSTLTYDYATNSPIADFAKVSLNLKYNRLVVVNFIDHDGSFFDQKEVVKGSAVELPADEPFRPGYTFKGWDSDGLDEVYYDMNVKAKYEIISGGEADTIRIAIDEVNFPDRNFRESVKEDFDLDKDGYLNTSEVLAVTNIMYTVWGIGDLKGVEFFTELTSLVVNGNSLESLDLSKNTKLESLQCYKNKLTELDLSNNKALKLLLCYQNELQSLILPEDNKISCIECQDNNLTDLDLSKCTNLVELNCSGNSLVVVDFAGNDVTVFNGENNKRDLGEVGAVVVIPGLDMSKVKNVVGGTPLENGFILSSDNTLTYDYLLGTYIKWGEEEEMLLNVTLTFTSNVVAELEINETNFPDEAFRKYVADNFDKDASGTLSVDERMNAKSIVYGENDEKSIANFTGMEHFTMLETFKSVGNSVSDYDFSNNVNLKNVEVRNGYILKSFNVSALTSLKTLWVGKFSGEKLDLSNNKNLTKLTLDRYSNTTPVDISMLAKLDTLNINSTSMTGIDVSHNTELLYLNVNSADGIEKIDLSKLTKLKYVNITATNISSLDFSNNADLADIYVYRNALLESVKLPMTQNQSFAYVTVDSNASLTELAINGFTTFKSLSVRAVPISSLDLSNCTNIEFFVLYKTQVAYINADNLKISSYSVSENAFDAGVVSADGFTVEGMDMGKVYVKSGAAIVDGKFVVEQGAEKITYTYTVGNRTPTFNIMAFVKGNGLPINEVNFPDDAFRNYVSKKIDTDGDGELRLTEIEAVESIYIADSLIYDLTGIEHFTKLYSLETKNVPLHTIDLSKNQKLGYVRLVSTELLGADLSNLPSGVSLTVTTRLSITSDGISIAGLDETKIKNLVGGKIVDGKIVPESDDVFEITYNYATGYICWGSEGEIGVKLFVEREGYEIVAINEENFPDKEFRNYVSVNYDRDHDGYLAPSEIQNAKRIWLQSREVATLKGVEFFTELQSFAVLFNESLESVDLSANKKLTSVTVYSTKVNELILPVENEITSIDCHGNALTSLDVTKCTKLEVLKCYNNKLTALDLSNNSLLESLDCSSNELTELNILGTSLGYLYCKNNHILTLDITGLPLRDAIISDQTYNAGMVDRRGFTIEGLDMSNVKINRDAKIVDDKFVPDSDDATSLVFYTICRTSDDYYTARTYYLYVVVNFTIDPTTPVETITIDNTPAEYYDLSGRKINAPTGKGVFVKKQNGKTQKILVK